MMTFNRPIARPAAAPVVKPWFCVLPLSRVGDVDAGGGIPGLR